MTPIKKKTFGKAQKRDLTLK